MVKWTCASPPVLSSSAVNSEINAHIQCCWETILLFTVPWVFLLNLLGAWQSHFLVEMCAKKALGLAPRALQGEGAMLSPRVKCHLHPKKYTKRLEM